MFESTQKMLNKMRKYNRNTEKVQDLLYSKSWHMTTKVIYLLSTPLTSTSNKTNALIAKPHL